MGVWEAASFATRIAAATVARLHADPTFRGDLDAARAEVAAVLLSKSPVPENCAAETAALAG